MAQTAIISPVSIDVQGEEVVISLHTHGEMNVFVNTVQVVKAVSQFVRLIHIREPTWGGLWDTQSSSTSSKSCIKKLVTTGVSDKLTAMPPVCS
jgi:hypothetical protein